MTEEFSTSAVIDGVAKVIAGAIDGYVFAAGVTEEVIGDTPSVVPLADDFIEAGMPAVTCALGPWKPALGSGLERFGQENPFRILCVIWVRRVPLGDALSALYGFRDAVADAFVAHGKAFLVVPEIQWAGLGGGPGIVPRAVPARAQEGGEGRGLFLTLPFTVNVHINRSVSPQPA